MTIRKLNLKCFMPEYALVNGGTSISSTRWIPGCESRFPPPNGKAIFYFLNHVHCLKDYRWCLPGHEMMIKSGVAPNIGIG